MPDSVTDHLKTVLLVSDADENRLATKWFLKHCGFSVESARGGDEALALFDPKTHDVVVMDPAANGMTGPELAHIVKLRSPATPVLMLAERTPENLSCLDAVILKPVHMLILKEALEQVVSGVGLA